MIDKTTVAVTEGDKVVVVVTSQPMPAAVRSFTFAGLDVFVAVPARTKREQPIP